MRRIRNRMVYVKNDTVCPADPTARTVITVVETRNGHKRKIELIQIWDLEVKLNGRRVAYGTNEATTALRKLIGLDPKQLAKANDRINPYFNDSMGSPGMYR